MGQVAECGNRLPSTKILIVDDCRLNRENLAAVFALIGVALPTVAWDLPSLNAVLNDAIPDIILVNMLTRDNGTLLRSIGEKCPDAKVIVVGVCEDDEPRSSRVLNRALLATTYEPSRSMTCFA